MHTYQVKPSSSSLGNKHILLLTENQQTQKLRPTPQKVQTQKQRAFCQTGVTIHINVDITTNWSLKKK